MSASTFTFKGHRFDKRRGRATFYYRAASGRHFAEKVDFVMPDTPLSKTQEKLLARALDFAMFMLGTSYYKSQPTHAIKSKRPISEKLAHLLNAVYQDGLSQFAFENRLTREDLAHFEVSDPQHYWHSLDYDGAGIISLQSGGKDSLLTAELLTEAKKTFRPVFIAGDSASHPEVLDHLGKPLTIIRRHLDLKSLKHAKGLNGHVPITFINYSLALIQAILFGYNEVVAGIGDEGVEPHAKIGDLEVRHQWSKTKVAEDLLNDFISSEISCALKTSSILRDQREIDIAKSFVEKCWAKYGHSFSSCNVANYQQRHNNKTLHWCADCAKCANSFLLFAPFLPASELISVIGSGEDLFAKSSLTEVYKGLLGVDGVMKPFECVGETSELREAYHHRQSGLSSLPFEVPKA